MKKRGFTQKGLLKAIHQMAEREGIPFVSREVPFDDTQSKSTDDYLKKLRRDHTKSAKVKINVDMKYSFDLYQRIEQAHINAGSSTHRFKEDYRVG